MPTRRLVSQDDQSIIQDPQVPRSKFLNTWTRKTAFDAGYLVPFLLDEVLPGDHMSYQITPYVRLQTLLFPIMDNQRVDTHIFFIPNRLVWSNWARFMGEQADPDESIDLTIPIITSGVGGYAMNSIYDHMGLPSGNQILGTETISHSALPFRAYNLVYNQWFRDQNLIDSLITNFNSNGPDLTTSYALRKRAKSHDYFTSALPWAQKFTAPSAPLSGNAPIIGLGAAVNATVNNADTQFYETDGALVTYSNWMDPVNATQLGINMTFPGGGGQNVPLVYADLSEATGVSINVFRQAFMVQSLLERDARGGTRYVELIKNHFRVTNPDFRLQRPEYIGGGQTPLSVTAIAQTAPTDDSVVGALGGVGTAAGQHSASYAATEHGYILGLISIKSELSYQQGIHRHWTRSTRYDFYWPSLAGLGEQAILNQEIFADGSVADADVFGYQERWHEYRTRYSEVTGYMKSTTNVGSLENWHLAQDFAAVPTLNQTFIEEAPPMTRVLAAGSEADGQQYLADILIRRTAIRPLPTFGTPVTLGRF